MAAVLRDIVSDAFGDEGTAGVVTVGGAAFGVVDAGCASTGAAMVRASKPIGKRESLSIRSILLEGGTIAVAAQNERSCLLFHWS